ncbi:hypothetical protein AWR27_12905 [Spirosoma montaniterrae]|uniref:AlgX/AlgJ SGNH hydrolase-like domain-containing protein n=2 Tax=Spirosoma montaniterrae TaxID=1178516 RepID=A0A1P9X4A2_9BACT|nr:hypothetical protein [Spirosoma montaniterrae]AQG82476.1 hypothetical protein AWR27_12905 [Spirosoma montaniterrae]
MRYLRYTILLIASVFWAAGLSGTVSHWLYEQGVIADDYRYGDLYRLSALPQFKQPQPTCPASNRASDTAATHLYLLGDSFTEPERISRNDFSVSHFQRIKWDFPQRVQLDSTRRNVLLIESVERHLREHLSRPVREVMIETDTTQTPTEPLAWYQRVYHDFHREDVEERLESALFSQDWAFWFKEKKASLTQGWFDRVSTGVSVSRNRQAIFLHSDADSSVMQSSFSPLTNRDVDAVVDSLNATAAYYRQAGFDAVYLSIIPNKISILESERGSYNRLIERVQQHPRLQVPVVNVYDAYRQNPQSSYLKGDTHWTCEGRATWLALVRQKLGV